MSLVCLSKRKTTPGPQPPKEKRVFGVWGSVYELLFNLPRYRSFEIPTGAPPEVGVTVPGIHHQLQNIIFVAWWGISNRKGNAATPQHQICLSTSVISPPFAQVSMKSTICTSDFGIFKHLSQKSNAAFFFPNFHHFNHFNPSTHPINLRFSPDTPP